MSESSFSEFSAQDTLRAAEEAQEWIEAVVGIKFPKKSFRESLENGILLCELMNKIQPGSIKKINKSKSPIAYLDNIQQFLNCCQKLGLNSAQLFDKMDLQEVKATRKVGVKRNESDRRIRSVCITLYWLGRLAAESEEYRGPQLDLALFKRLMEGNFSDPEDEEVRRNKRKPLNHNADVYPDTFEDNPRIMSLPVYQAPHIESPPTSEDPPIESPVTNGILESDDLGLTFEQEQTADELLADIQNAVDEMLQDFQTSPVAVNPPPVAQKKNRDVPAAQKKPPSIPQSKITTEHSIVMKTKNGGFGFQILGGVDSELQAQVDYIVPGSAADSSGLQVGDMMVSVNGQNIQHLSHVNLVSVIKKAGQMGQVTLGINRSTPNTVEEKTDHTPLGDSQDELFGFSRRESRESWEEENEERERQAQEIAMMYPHRSTGPHPVENGGPPTTFGTAPLPPLVEHQEEALFEQFQEMLDSASSPPPSPPPSPIADPSVPSSSSQNSSHPISPLTISPTTNQLQDDKATIEREIEELARMEAAKPKLEDTQSMSASESEEEHAHTKSPRKEATPAVKKVEFDSEQHVQVPIELENEDTIAIKYDTFRVEETNSPLPLSPITEVSPDAEVSPRPGGNDQELFTPVAAPVPPADSDPEQTLDKELCELDELLNFTESSKLQPKAAASDELSPADAIVTPPPMFDSPLPPKPKTEAPKRASKRPAPPPPKPKPKKEAAAVPPEPQPEPHPEPQASTTTGDVDTSLSRDLEGEISDSPFQRSQSPDLVTQMQELAYSKSITSSDDWSATKPQELLEKKQFPQQDKKTSSLPRNMHMGLNQSPYHQKQQSPYHQANQTQHTPTTASEGFASSTPSDSTTPKMVEVLGNIKIQHVMKKRWTPKSSSAEPSPAQTPEHQHAPPVSYKDRSSTMPNIYNGYGHTPNGAGAPVVAKGIGIGIGRPSGMGQTQMKFQPIPAKGNPYQQNLQQQQQSWKSQEELRGNYNQQKSSQYARQRFSSTPDGTKDYRVQKSMSMPRGGPDNARNRTNTWAANKGGGAPAGDGYQVVYAIQPSNPHDLCSRCHQSLGQGTVLSLPTLRTVYHVKCLVCRVCRTALTQGAQSTTVLVKSRQPHCRFCVSGNNGTQTTEC